MTPRVYLDHNATAPLLPAAREAALEAMALAGNASSVHAEGRRVRALLERARAEVAGLADVAARQVVFTSGGTEANHLALGGGRRRLLVSAVEHPSVLAAVPRAEPIPVARDGRVDLDALDRLFHGRDGAALVSVMAANNETGIVQPIEEVAAIARAHGAVLHCDAVQAAGKRPLGALEVDLMTLSGHKIGGMQGAGALIVGDGVELAPELRGGGQEFGLRSGTQALPAIAAFGAAARHASRQAWRPVAALRDRLQRDMVALVPGALPIGERVPRLPNTLAIAHPWMDAETLVMAFDLEGVAVSAGAACSSGKVGASHVLRAMGLEGPARRAIRLSLGARTSPEDIDRAVEAWRLIDRRAARAA